MSLRRGVMQTGLVSAKWLQSQLQLQTASGKHTVKVIDATFHLPVWERDAIAEFNDAHIPTATFFDVDNIKDETSDLPHMLCSAERFQQEMQRRGINNGDHIVVYDCSDFGIFSAPRLWWMCRVFGYDNVSVLDGGLKHWKDNGFPLASGQMAFDQIPPGNFTVKEERTHLVVPLAQIYENVTSETPRFTLLDARSEGRFAGRDPEPRPGISSGHMAHSKSLPFSTLLTDDGFMKSGDALKNAFSDAGVDMKTPLVASCGSGVTACMISFAGHLISVEGDEDVGDIPVYDGAWAEWAETYPALILKDEEQEESS